MLRNVSAVRRFVMTTKSSPSHTSSSSCVSPRSVTLRHSVEPSSKKWMRSASVLSNHNPTSTPFSPWRGEAKITCHGDYRQEAWIEDHTGGPLYAHQRGLPRIPVNNITDTLERFLPTALPLARTREEEAALRKAVEAFPSQAAALQERLQRRKDEYHSSSWLQHWWNTAGYLQVRDTVVINVSYFFHFKDDIVATTQSKRAAALLTGVADFRKLVCSGQLPAEKVGRNENVKALCSTAYKYMFHSCRIPIKVQDSYHLYDPSRHNHVIVACKGHFFAMDFCHPVTGDPYPLPVLEAGLQECRQQAELLVKEGTVPLFGWLTSQNRDDWAAGHDAMMAASPQFGEALEVLESGALMICLDDENGKSRHAMAELLLHSGKNVASGANRWYDKSIQLIVTPDGKAGLVGEHAMMDGMPVVNFANRLCEITYEKAIAYPHDVTTTTCRVRPIFVNATKQVADPNILQSLVTEAKQAKIDWVDRHSLSVQSFRGYGSDLIKKMQFSPDAFVQVAMQLATYRLWGEQAGTYEASQVRPFLHGRTETTRSVSLESADFVRCMGLRRNDEKLDDESRSERIERLRKACLAHVRYVSSAGQAQGVDRHFLGLAMLLQDREQPPDLFLDPVYQRSKRWRVSTSHLTHPGFENWGFGEVVPDGVGVAYSIHKEHCMFNIVALKEHDWTEKLADLIEEALIEMKALFETNLTNPTSKL